MKICFVTTAAGSELQAGRWQEKNSKELLPPLRLETRLTKNPAKLQDSLLTLFSRIITCNPPPARAISMEFCDTLHLCFLNIGIIILPQESKLLLMSFE